MNIAIINAGILIGSIFFGLICNYVLSKFLISENNQTNRYRPNMLKLSRHFPLIVMNLFILFILSIIGVTLFQQYFDTNHITLITFVNQFFLILILDDMEFYFWHRFLHKNSFMMKHIHSIHHRARVPYPIEFIYVHPIEWLGGTIGIVIAFVFIIYFFGSVNAYVLWSYTAYRTLREMSSHTNFTVYFATKIPLLPLSGVKHHSLHHARLRGNYASTFTYLDKLLGTTLKE